MTSSKNSNAKKPSELRALAIAKAGSIANALKQKTLKQFVDISLSEALILGFLRQGINTYIGIFGHGSTDVGEMLRIYQQAGVVKVINLRNEVEASHVGVALKWQFNQTAVVFTSIGPGALQALAGSLVASSNGIGLYYLFGDETNEDEGFNMQQIPRFEQGLYGKMFANMGCTYTLNTGRALPNAMKSGISAVFNPSHASPCYFLLPMNVQSEIMENFNIEELPIVPNLSKLVSVDESNINNAIKLIAQSKKIVVKVGNGAKNIEVKVLEEFLERTDAAFVHGPSAVGILGGNYPRNMTVGGSKGSISGNAVMESADLVITIGARGVCQWDSSGTAWKNAKNIIAINSRVEDAIHYNRTLPLIGDANYLVNNLLQELKKNKINLGAKESSWYKYMITQKKKWQEYLQLKLTTKPLFDKKFNKNLITEPQAIATVVEFAKKISAVKYFDAGDVQANGFQIVEDEKVGLTITDTGASYMGFAASGILASAIVKINNPKLQVNYPIAFCGDGSFMMNPQILIDAVEYGLHGMVVIFDNRRMAAISGLQKAQYNQEFATDDNVIVDYAAMANSVKGVLGISSKSTIEELQKALLEGHAHK